MLLNGLKGKIDSLRNKGLDEVFIDKLKTDNHLLATYNEELDKLKAELKSKTIQTNRKVMEIKNQVKEAKRIIKRDYLQQQWKEFGITDKR